MSANNNTLSMKRVLLFIFIVQNYRGLLIGSRLDTLIDEWTQQIFPYKVSWSKEVDVVVCDLPGKPPFGSANAGKRWIYVYPISSVSALILRFSLWIRLA